MTKSDKISKVLLSEMEITGGEPDVVGHDKNEDEFIFI